MFLPVTNAYRLITIISYDGVRRYLFKIKSEINIDDVKSLDLESIVFLITERDEYQRLLITSPRDLGQLLTFQKPFIYRTIKEKKKAIAHCVHNIRNLDKRRMLEFKNWLGIQERIGIDVVKLYFLDVKKEDQQEVVEYVGKKNWNMKIDIIDYRY